MFLPQEGGILPEVSSITSLLEASKRLAQNIEALADLMNDAAYNSLYDDADTLRTRIDHARDGAERYDALATTLEARRAEAREQGTVESVQAVDEAEKAILAEWESDSDWGSELRELQGEYLNMGNRYADLYENEMRDIHVPALGGIPLAQVTFLAPRFTDNGFFPQKAPFIEELSRSAGYYTDDEYENKLTGKTIPVRPDNAKSNWNEPPRGYIFNTLEGMSRVVVFYTRRKETESGVFSDNVIFAPTDLETPMTLGTDPSRYAFVEGSYYRIAPPFPPPGLGGEEGKESLVESFVPREEEEEWMLL
jgi:hypothetical protein